MEFYEVLERRRTMRDMSGREVSEEKLERIIAAATVEGLVTAFHVPIEDEAEYVKRKVNAPAGYELPCFLAIGYPADGAHVCVQKEIDPKTRIHTNEF